MGTADLDSIMPFDAVDAYFAGAVRREEWRVGDVETVMKLVPKDMFSLAINCVMRAKNIFQPDLDVRPLGPYLEQGSPALIYPLSTVLSQPAMDDLYCCRCTVGGQVVASLLVAQVYPRDLYIGMVTFADPSKPIPPEKRKSVMQKFEGLGLLGELMSRADACAAARRCDNITLAANETSHVGLYQKYGFVVDPYPYAKGQLSQGQLIPMHKPVV